MNKELAKIYSIAAASASNVLGLKPVAVGSNPNAASTVDNMMEVALTSGRKYPRVAVTQDGTVVVASRPTIKRHGWKPLNDGKNLLQVCAGCRSTPAAE